jgi:hypothetical protein
VVTSWQAFMGPARHCRATCSREFNAELVNGAECARRPRPASRSRAFDVVAQQARGSFADFQRKEIARWRDVVKQKGLALE